MCRATQAKQQRHFRNRNERSGRQVNYRQKKKQEALTKQKKCQWFSFINLHCCSCSPSLVLWPFETVLFKTISINIIMAVNNMYTVCDIFHEILV